MLSLCVELGAAFCILPSFIIEPTRNHLDVELVRAVYI